MYVQRLIEFADEHPEDLVPIGFKEKKIQWIADIEEGKISLTNAGNRQEIVPDIARSSGTKPILLVDKADYVFAVSDTKEHEKRSKERHEAYVDLLAMYLEKYEDEDMKLLYECMINSDSFMQEVIDQGVKMNDHICFRIHVDQFLHKK